MLSAVVVMLVAFSMINATQYARMKVTPTAGVTLYDPYVRVMGCDIDPTGTYDRAIWQADNASTGENLYTITFGNWLPGTNVSLTGAFALVNELNYDINVKANVTGAAAGYVYIYAHGNWALTSSSEVTDNPTETGGVQLWAGAATGNYWTLAAGNQNPNDYVLHNITDVASTYTSVWDDTVGSGYVWEIQDAFDVGTGRTPTVYGAVNATSDCTYFEVVLLIPSDQAAGPFSFQIGFDIEKA